MLLRPGEYGEKMLMTTLARVCDVCNYYNANRDRVKRYLRAMTVYFSRVTLLIWELFTSEVMVYPLRVRVPK